MLLGLASFVVWTQGGFAEQVGHCRSFWTACGVLWQGLSPLLCMPLPSDWTAGALRCQPCAQPGLDAGVHPLPLLPQLENVLHAKRGAL